MAIPRSRSAPRIARTLSGSLTGHSSGNNHSRRRRYAARCGLILGFFFLCTYLGIYLKALHSAIHLANQKVRDTSKQELSEIQQQVRRNKGIAADASSKETLVVSTDAGDLRIVLRPDLSSESVDYIKQVVASSVPCKRCTLYRVEQPGILQGIIKHTDIPLPTKKGSCPAGLESVDNKCPEWDKHCNCHGPIMTHGMVGWAAGDTGPDFFIDDYLRPAKWWGTQHTVWGEIQDDASFKVIDVIWTLPTHKQGSLTHLKTPLNISLSIENSAVALTS